MSKQVVASIASVLSWPAARERLEGYFSQPSLQLVTLTITEKGYSVAPDEGCPLSARMEAPASRPAPLSTLAVLTGLMFRRYEAGQGKVALVSLDNCSHNGTVLKDAMTALAKNWARCGLVDGAFPDYLHDETRVSFPWTMIDKITPGPSEEVIRTLREEGLEDVRIVRSSKGVPLSAVVNAEEFEERVAAVRAAIEATRIATLDADTRRDLTLLSRERLNRAHDALGDALAVLAALRDNRSSAKRRVVVTLCGGEPQ